MKVSVHLLGYELVAVKIERLAELLEGIGGGAGDDGAVDPDLSSFGFVLGDDEEDRAR